MHRDTFLGQRKESGQVIRQQRDCSAGQVSRHLEGLCQTVQQPVGQVKAAAFDGLPQGSKATQCCGQES